MKKIFRYMMLAGFLFCLGCNYWLDVNPKRNPVKKYSIPPRVVLRMY